MHSVKNPGLSLGRHQAIGLFAIVVMAIGILAICLFLVQERSRSRIQDQFLSQPAELLGAVMSLQLQDDLMDEFTVALESSRLQGVMGVRMFNRNGKLTDTFPAHLKPVEELSPAFLATIEKEGYVSIYQPAQQVEDLFFLPTEVSNKNGGPVPVPIHEMIIPVVKAETGQFDFLAQFIVEGYSIQKKYADLDRTLFFQSAMALGFGSLFLGLGLTWFLSRLQGINKQLEDRTKALLEANHALSISARASAVGTLTAHLMHGLKTPIAGLSSFISSEKEEKRRISDTAIETVEDIRNRMSSQVEEICRVIQENEESISYLVTLKELFELLDSKCRKWIPSNGVDLNFKTEVHFEFNNYQANLLILILENLISNAIHATPAGKKVTVCCLKSEECLRFLVVDQGNGLAESMKNRLFTPIQSQKTNGTGIGLVLSKRLSEQLGADLHLTRNSPEGCTFEVVIKVAKEKANATHSISSPSQNLIISPNPTV